MDKELQNSATQELLQKKVVPLRDELDSILNSTESNEKIQQRLLEFKEKVNEVIDPMLDILEEINIKEVENIEEEINIIDKFLNRLPKKIQEGLFLLEENPRLEGGDKFITDLLDALNQENSAPEMPALEKEAIRIIDAYNEKEEK